MRPSLPALRFVLVVSATTSIIALGACSEEEEAPARVFSDAATSDGSSVTPDGASSSDGSSVTDSATGTDVNVTPVQDAAKTDAAKPDTGTDAKTDAPTDAPGVDAATAACDAYCTANIATCVGNDVQYIDKATCVAMCANMAAGAANDASGDSVACRTTHTNLAVGNTATHCPHGGAYGGATCGTTRCANFCKLALAKCPTGAGGPFADEAACLAACPGFAFDAPPAKIIDATLTKKFNCVAYHLEAAYLDPVTHCGHITTAAGPCSL